MKEALPCPFCGNNFGTGPSLDESEMLIWWDCECGLSGPDALTQEDAIKSWNEMVVDIQESDNGRCRD